MYARRYMRRFHAVRSFRSNMIKIFREAVDTRKSQTLISYIIM